jgi:hypothetical protein
MLQNLVLTEPQSKQEDAKKNDMKLRDSFWLFTVSHAKPVLELEANCIAVADF